MFVAAALQLSVLSCSSGADPAPAAPDRRVTTPTAPGSEGIVFVEYSYASTYTTQGVYALHQVQPGDLMLLYLTDMDDFPPPPGWMPIGDAIVLHKFGAPVKGFYRVRQAGDPTTYNIAQTTGFLSVYRHVDPENPIDSFVHAVSESQTPSIGSLIAPAGGAASVYFFIGLYHSDILAPAGYEEIYGCRYHEGSSHDTGTGHRLGLRAGETAGGNIFVAYPDCQSPGEPPHREAILHVMLTPTDTASSTSASPDLAAASGREPPRCMGSIRVTRLPCYPFEG